jgi:hypothetical protein
MIRLRNSAARTHGDFRLVLACLLAVGIVPAGAQEPQRAQPDPPAAISPPAPAPRQGEAGPFGTIGRFIDNSLLDLTLGFKGAREQVDDLTGRAHGAAKDAAGAVTRLRRPGVVAGRELCPAAPNGAPDCATATIAMCRANGFESGSSIDMQTEEKCPPQVWTTARPPAENECRLESYVTRALCR